MKKKSHAGYNERLFSNDFRGTLHSARYRWLAQSLARLDCAYESVLELGCFDGKAIDFLPSRPESYLGLDANWEGGLDIAADRWQGEPRFEFRFCETPDQMGVPEKSYDISICMETLEHVPPQMVGSYLEALASATRDYVFITVPNEKGIVFFFKYLAKKLMGGDVRHYSFSEFINATLGNMDKVERDEHKGFNYREMIEAISTYFDIVEVSGHPITFAPAILNFGVGIIGTPRRVQAPHSEPVKGQEAVTRIAVPGDESSAPQHPA